MLSVKWWYCIVNQNITVLIHSLYSISILITCSFLLAYACVRPFALTCIYIPPTSPKGYCPSVPILLLDSLGIGKRCFESRSNSYFLNPFLDGLLISPEISKVSFELLKGFSVTPEKWKQQGMFLSYSKPFGLLPKALPSGFLSEVRKPVFIALFLGLIASYSILP